MANRERMAIVTGRRGEDGRELARRVKAYLPDNYRVTEWDENTRGEPTVFIEGHDHAGWTLDGYVIPRLASGLIVASEYHPGQARTRAAGWRRRGTSHVYDDATFGERRTRTKLLGRTASRTARRNGTR